MDCKFWLEDWQTQHIPFHRKQVNEMLTKHYPQLQLQQNDTVFVPLCGKSIDMAWLREQGHLVLGVELSPVAVEDYYVSQQLEYARYQAEHFEVYQNPQTTIFCGDFFNLDANLLKPTPAIYDRAALVALAPEQRTAYAQKLSQLQQIGGKILLVTLTYPQEEMQGPPYSIEEQEIYGLFNTEYTIQCLERDEGALARSEYLQQQGLSHLTNSVYLLTKK